MYPTWQMIDTFTNNPITDLYLPQLEDRKLDFQGC